MRLQRLQAGFPQSNAYDNGRIHNEHVRYYERVDFCQEKCENVSSYSADFKLKNYYTLYSIIQLGQLDESATWQQTLQLYIHSDSLKAL